FSYRALAKKHGCSRTTLTRQHKGQAPPREDMQSGAKSLFALTHGPPQPHLITNFKAV
ncbi:hypothetical protein EJ07DRAFT_96726, partial [Lizonia empirigonia]